MPNRIDRGSDSLARLRRNLQRIAIGPQLTPGDASIVIGTSTIVVDGSYTTVSTINVRESPTGGISTFPTGIGILISPASSTSLSTNSTGLVFTGGSSGSTYSAADASLLFAGSTIRVQESSTGGISTGPNGIGLLISPASSTVLSTNSTGLAFTSTGLGYLPLTGGTLTGNLSVIFSTAPTSVLVYDTAGSSPMAFQSYRNEGSLVFSGAFYLFQQPSTDLLANDPLSRSQVFTINWLSTYTNTYIGFNNTSSSTTVYGGLSAGAVTAGTLTSLGGITASNTVSGYTVQAGYLISNSGYAVSLDGGTVTTSGYGHLTAQQLSADALPYGSLLSPPAGLNIGDIWMDSTTSAQYPILRIRRT